MSINTDPEKIEALLTRGVSEVINKEDLRKELLSGRQLRIKLGIDPTSPNLHLGRATSILKLRDFQELGHKIVLLIGDATGVIGDTSDKDSERPMLTKRDVKNNLKTYFKQAGLLLNMWKIEKQYNSKWLNKLGYEEIGEHANAFSLADFIARDNIKKRLDAGKRVSLREMLYPLMQGYDSVALQADVEIGGNDQRFNLLAGRTLQEAFGQKPQNILMSELIMGLDGRKMSSSWGNTINLTDSAQEMFGKTMSMRDEEIIQYFIACTRVPMDEVKTIEKELSQGANPRDAKVRLAKEIVSLYHGQEAGEKEAANFEATFKKGGMPEDAPTVSANSGDSLVEVLASNNIVESKTDARRLIDNGAITNIDSGEKITDTNTTIETSLNLKVGKHRFVKITI